MIGWCYIALGWIVEPFAQLGSMKSGPEAELSSESSVIVEDGEFLSLVALTNLARVVGLWRGVCSVATVWG